MTTPRAKLLTFLLSVLTTCALAAGSDAYSGAADKTDLQCRPKGAHLRLGTVLQLTQAELSRHGILPSDFEASRFSYGCEKDKGCEWTILYRGKASAWHGQISQLSMTVFVTINDRTQHADLLPHIVNGK
jgi:hypothetical protein